ncbi:hypothetical protein BDV34DRAFT_233304 [Aspergillus parasiticus]|uniref:Uncharacterized protein n=1 Tax=Aspergillus parasiticus TaxID=5067 RepID=A0A5N6DTU7_ASPPA|nr:hypothetical protein BDV34DRAFT_233304 [Aspergillus parasiticus]
MLSRLPTLSIYLLSSVVLLGAFSRFTHGAYTPGWYAFQEYHAPDNGSTLAMITPVIDTIIGLTLLFGARTAKYSAAAVSLTFFIMGLAMQVLAGKDYKGDVALVCDKAQPICQRCIKSRRTCYGMRDQQVWHTENSYASRQKKRPRGPRSMKMNLHVSYKPADMRTYAIAYYMHNYVQAPNNVPDIVKDVTRGCLAVLPPRPWCPFLELAVSSLALAMFSRTQNYPSAALVASATYHRLLKVAQSAIHYLTPDNCDSCLLAVFFMGRYEDSVYRPVTETPFVHTSPSFLHHDGALAILKVWNDRLSRDRPATNVINHTRRGLIRSALMRNAALPHWIHDGAFFGEHGLELEYDRIIISLVNLRHRLFALTNEVTARGASAQTRSTLILEELESESHILDVDLETCISHIPSAWHQLQRHTLSNVDLPSWPSSDFYSPTLYSYPNPAYAALWGHYKATKMLIKSTRLRILALHNPNNLSLKKKLLSDMHSVSEDLAAIVPFALQRFKLIKDTSSSPSSPGSSVTLNLKAEIKPIDSSLVIWPLTIASGLEYVGSEHKAWFKAQLARLGRLVGFGILETAETDQWLEL